MDTSRELCEPKFSVPWGMMSGLFIVPVVEQELTKTCSTKCSCVERMRESSGEPL